MDPVTFALLVGAGVLGVAQLFPDRKGRDLVADWSQAAERAGIEDVSTTRKGGRRSLQGAHGVLRVTFTVTNERTQVVIAGLAGDFTLARRSPPVFGMSLPEKGLETGDPGFDRQYVVNGDPLVAYAVLDADTREELIRDGITVEPGGRVRTILSNHERPDRAEQMAASLRPLLAFCHRFVEPEHLDRAVARNLEREPEAGVRRRALALLVAGRPDHPATQAAVRASLADRDDEVRLIAARAVGTEGREVLRALALDPSATDAVVSRAVVGLGPAFSEADVVKVLTDALAAGYRQTLLACLASPALPPTAEALLARALASEEEEVRLATAAALGRLGTASAVPALREVEQDASGELRRAAREAVASIQARLVGAEQGQLSVAPAAGELSLTDDARGRVGIRRDGE